MWKLYEWTKFSHQKRDAPAAVRAALNGRLSALKMLAKPLPQGAFTVVQSSQAINNILSAAGSNKRHNTIMNNVMEDRIDDHWRIFLTVDGTTDTINCILIGHLKDNNSVEKFP